MPLALVMDGFIALIVALMYWFYSNTLAGAGGEYLYVSRVINPRVGFVVNVISWFGIGGVNAFTAYACASFFATAFHSVSPVLGTWFTTPSGILVTALLVLWLSFLLHYRGIRWMGHALQVVTIIIAATVVTLLVLSLTHTPAQLFGALKSQTGLSAVSLMTHTLKPIPQAFLKALPALYLSYIGLRFVTFTGGETQNARRVVGQVIIVLVPLYKSYLSFP